MFLLILKFAISLFEYCTLSKVATLSPRLLSRVGPDWQSWREALEKDRIALPCPSSMPSGLLV